MAYGTASFQGQPAIQVSRRSNRLNPETDTAALKLLKVVTWMKGQDMRPWRLTIPAGLYAELQRHLFPGDDDEHGAVILAGTCESDRGLRLVARELHLAKDGVDYVPGKRGYRMLKAEFIQSKILRARDRRLAYLAIHNHGGIRLGRVLRARYGVSRTRVPGAPRHRARHAGRGASPSPGPQ